MITTTQLQKISYGGANTANCNSIVTALDIYGYKVGLNKPHRLAHYIARLAVESGGFKYDHEIWGPTTTQKRYDTRTDLGNTAAVDGDGYKYRGRGPIQITGKANYASFSAWAKLIDTKAPDFVATPDAVVTDPWEGLAPIWYWSTRTRNNKSLNTYADENNAEMVCQIINGGLNGFKEQLEYYTRTALILLDFAPNDIVGFQKSMELNADGIAGPATRNILHKRLAAQDSIESVPVGTPDPISSDPFELVERRLANLEKLVNTLMAKSYD